MRGRQGVSDIRAKRGVMGEIGEGERVLGKPGGRNRPPTWKPLKKKKKRWKERG